MDIKHIYDYLKVKYSTLYYLEDQDKTTGRYNDKKITPFTIYFQKIVSDEIAKQINETEINVITIDFVLNPNMLVVLNYNSIIYPRVPNETKYDSTSKLSLVKF